MKRNAFLAALFALSAAFAATDASAQGKAKADGPCAADSKKFCANVAPGGGRIAECMKSHQAELSPACQSAIKAAHDKLEQLAKACKGDAEKYCKGVKPGAGRILSCLKGRESDLSPACAAEFRRASSDPTASR
jgi:cysteine rich repeat protein